jgi:predicted nucleotidyltransferase component of viral defense system
MRPLRDRIRDAARQSGTQQTVIEKDYALSYVLGGIAVQPELAQSLVFKGGTALKKLFFGNYRFSEDLDFSTIDAPKRDDLEQAIHRAIDHAAQATQELIHHRIYERLLDSGSSKDFELTTAGRGGFF